MVGAAVLSQHSLYVVPSTPGQQSVPSGKFSAAQRLCMEQSAAAVGDALGRAEGTPVGRGVGAPDG